ncbi:hypothetical protein B0H14DRAFT_3453908 [Mycena olivaceomarginata]|nr:hypothetical protein B0H14DRAFT_3453908 [Mycena olivaceomarginata]
MLFNNAGIITGHYARPRPSSTTADYVAAFFDVISQDDFTDTLNTNAIRPYGLTLAFLPLFECRKTPDMLTLRGNPYNLECIVHRTGEV